MDKDQTFLKEAGKFLDLKKWGEFLLKWANALESYGTPRDFVYPTGYKEGNVKFNGKETVVVYSIGSNSDKRRELMAKQKPYIPLDDVKNYGLRLSLGNCFLCENVVQGVDAQNYPDGVKNNVMYDLGMHLILPNRYPGGFGHSLSVPKNHDDQTSRVMPQPDQVNKTTTYIPEEGKTRGKILTADYLDAVIEASDKLNLIALRNHVLDGMSIPAHDHFHMLVEDLPNTSQLEKIVNGKQKTEYGSNIYRSGNTHFDTLLIRQEENQNIASVATPILEQMELNDQVFTLIYNKGSLLISPRYKEKVDDRRIQVGGGIPMHHLDTQGQEFIDRINKFVPIQRCYGWDRFIH